MNQPMVRAFVAIEMPAEIQSQLDQVMKQLRAARISGVRWVAASNIHLTLKFLGDTSQADLNRLAGQLTTAAAQFHPMELSVGGLGAFPNRRQPRVIWIGVKIPSEVHDLFRLIEDAAKQIGSKPEERGFSPHLTLGRVQRNATRLEVEGITGALASVEIGDLGFFQAEGFTLFRSDLHPTGSIYTPLLHFPFKG